MAKVDLAASITPLCEKTAEGFGYEIVEVALDREPTGSFLRIYLDRPDGITLNDCEAFHRKIQPLLERFDYDYLEVSSPGIDRPLKTERDFERAVGSEVEVKLYAPIDGSKQYLGVLAAYSMQAITLRIGDVEKEIKRSAIAIIRPQVDMEGVETVDLSDEMQIEGEDKL